MARHKHPGQRNNLDALCQRYEIDNTSRTLHGALLDAEILAEVYLAMTGGQASLGLGAESSDASSNGVRAGKRHQALGRRTEATDCAKGKPRRDRATRGQTPGARPQCGRGGMAEITPPLIQRLTYTAAKPTDVSTIV
jgi:DNA polymerase III epsilon subunit-like protein